jgi:hypothetical protein
MGWPRTAELLDVNGASKDNPVNGEIVVVFAEIAPKAPLWVRTVPPLVPSPVIIRSICAVLATVAFAAIVKVWATPRSVPLAPNALSVTVTG